MMLIKPGLRGYSLCSMTLEYKPVRAFRSLRKTAKADNVKTSIKFTSMMVNIEKDETLKNIHSIKCGPITPSHKTVIGYGAK